MIEGRWSQKYLSAIGDKEISADDREKIESHIQESFVIRSTSYFKFDDGSFISITQRGGYFQIFEINEEKYEKKKKEARGKVKVAEVRQ